MIRLRLAATALALALGLASAAPAGAPSWGAHAALRAQVAEARHAEDAFAWQRAGFAVAAALAMAPDDPDLLVLRAMVRQAGHGFDAALADLDRAILLAPGAPQARLTRAFLRVTTGDLAGAGADCRALPARAGRVVRTACAARVLDAGGDPAAAARLLAPAAARAPASLRPWVHELMAAFTTRAGMVAAARRHHAALAALAPGVERHAVAHAAFLRSVVEPEAALARVAAATSDGGILERALARRALGQDASAEIAILDRRFARDAAEGGEAHLREAARFRLALMDDAEGAWALAQRNWARQREPEDRALLLETASAVGAARHARQRSTRQRSTR
ncbi:MAG: hypothetical protein AAFV86_00750 [Pseudomonadota bacterium]